MSLSKDLVLARLPKHLQALNDLLESKGIDLADLESASIDRVNVWQGMSKNAEGEQELADLAAIQFSPSWDSGPAWPVIEQAPPVSIKGVASKGTPLSLGERTVALPDIQFGYWRDLDGVLHETHDERALQLALQVVADADPTGLVYHGDNLDLPELSKYRKHPAFQQTTQPAINRASEYSAQLTAVTPRAEGNRKWLAGNHEERLPNHILDNAVAAFGLTRAQADKWEPEMPVMSVPHLCRTAEVGWDYVPGYPRNRHMVNDNLQVIHGHKTGKSVVTDYLNDERVSTLYGHVHRQAYASRTRMGAHGPRTISAGSAGCLCRIDGVVPGTHASLDEYGQPIPSYEDWQQGIWVIDHEPGDGRFRLDLVSFYDDTQTGKKWCIWNGNEYSI